MIPLLDRVMEIRHAHLFCGLGGGARGFNRGHARVGQLVARMRCLGGIDVDPAACRDFEHLAEAPATCLDLFDREQYRAFHGCEPPEGWREATPDDIRRAFGGERPNIIFSSPPCKGLSGLLSQEMSQSERYQALNRLTVRGVTLALQAYNDDPPEFVLFENVPRIATRGRALLDRIVALLELFGYAVAETTHDCGELGGLAQSRRRFLLVARHRAKVPPFLYQPPRRRLRGVGEVLERLPLPGADIAGPMHRMRALQWRTWVRLAFVEAGADWRSLERLRVVDGMLADFGIVPEASWHHGALGVTPWDAPAGTVTGGAAPSTGSFSVADPRPGYSDDYGQLGVTPWDSPASTLTSQRSPGQGRFAVADPRPVSSGDRRALTRWAVTKWDEHADTIIANARCCTASCVVADPRLPENPGRHWNKFRVIPFDSPAGTVIGNVGVGDGAASVADPRLRCDAANRQERRFNNVFRVVRWADVGPTVTGGNGPSAGGVAVADPRPGCSPRGGGYGVTRWDDPAGAVTGAACHDNGPHSVADPRLPAADDRLVAVIRALDGTWHRPFTTLELAALQGLVDPGEWLELDGSSDTAWRERIGNAVPSPAAEAVASVMAHALLLAWSGETFELSSTPIWVRPVAVALAVEQGRGM